VIFNLLEAATPFKFLTPNFNSRHTKYFKPTRTKNIRLKQQHFIELTLFHVITKLVIVIKIALFNQVPNNNLSSSIQLEFFATHWRILATHKFVATLGLRTTGLYSKKKCV
jgi:hypothetical protein